MSKAFIGSAIALALTSTHPAAAPIHMQADIAGIGTVHGEQIWLVQGDKGNGPGNGKAGKKDTGNAGNRKAPAGNGNGNAGKGNEHAAKGDGKREHSGGPNLKPNGKDLNHPSWGNGKGVKGLRAFTTAEREEVFSRIVATPIPAGRDMRHLLGATALALATPRLLVSDIPEEELITYRNCPPGLAKKNPPCVPPGLARNGVTYDEWTSYDQDEYNAIWAERRDGLLRSQAGIDPDPELLLLQSDQIATLFDLDPAPSGQRYALIDGLPVLLDQDDYDALLLVNQMAQAPEIEAGTPIAPTAALTQDELIDVYRLPQTHDDENYAVVNGQIVRLNDANYELLQMIRVARAVL